VSLPDFDPNNPAQRPTIPTAINRLKTGFQMGSTFKALTWRWRGLPARPAQYEVRARGAMHDGKSPLTKTIPRAVRISASEFHILLDVGACAHRAGEGVEAHKAFLKKLGQLDRCAPELRERFADRAEALSELKPSPSPEVTALRVAPLKVGDAEVNAVMNGGYLSRRPASASEEEAQAMAKRVIKHETSEKCAI